MKLPPQAHRLISGLIARYPDEKARQRWLAWDKRHANEDLSPEVAKIVVDVLAHFSRIVEQTIDGGKLTDDQMADAVNDLGYAQAIGTEIKKSAFVEPR